MGLSGQWYVSLWLRLSFILFPNNEYPTSYCSLIMIPSIKNIPYRHKCFYCCMYFMLIYALSLLCSMKIQKVWTTQQVELPDIFFFDTMWCFGHVPFFRHCSNPTFCIYTLLHFWTLHTSLPVFCTILMIEVRSHFVYTFKYISKYKMEGKA